MAWQQLSIAETWVARADAYLDVFYQFVCYFTAFNATYFFWRRHEETATGKKQSGEKRYIEIPVSQFSAEQTSSLLKAGEKSIQFFVNRGGVLRMDARTIEQPWMGDDTEGCTCVAVLQSDGASDVEKLVALTKLVYLVRCNLVHGGKTDSGSDEYVTANGLAVLSNVVPSRIELTNARVRLKGAEPA